ncbi:MAG: 8-amino-7-oxononanoate synthase [Anaerobiospirillum succiniciproducens]|uniref:aminotransferase class I/II-fold pyridoxal phosphate-dependent enzyme n=1 Tax=Anaerobiospirillum succiniciproducens TaxID=13335 RepID=UPI002353524B|nr:8-amino-7-oxononanoate synthase [Anaerobiospirillum succiniciproducens]MCI6863606.1 8-amino-7-oxononanoate synthase [Anaerobiospirillum succiniciproducens]MDY2799149.1 8-amino-7-oxononanoate synthase [Anaerobiospirillum succiniciproducens]
MGKLFYQRLRSELKARQLAGNLRELPLVSFQGDNIMLDNMPYIDLSSNDYLCIARDPKFFTTFIETMLDSKSSGSQFAGEFLISAISAGSTGSRLLTGNHTAYYFAEDLIASLFNGSMFSSINGEDESSLYGVSASANTPKYDEAGKDEVEAFKQGSCCCADSDSGNCSQASSAYAFSTDGVGDDLKLASSDPITGAVTQELDTNDHRESAAQDLNNANSSLHHDDDSAAIKARASKRVPKGGSEINDYDALASEEDRTGYKAPDVKARACLYVNSGFDANSGVLSALFGKHDLLLVDKLSHASIIDGMLHSEAKALRYAHNDMQHLEQLLQKHAHEYESVVIVTESVFSMDGDQAKLKEIVALKERYDNVLLYVDEAHSFGLFGDDGLGLCKELNLLDKVDFLMGTLGKAIGSHGAFLICSKEVKDYLVNFMRPLIYSTALPPVNITFSMYVVGLLRANAMHYKRDYLRKISSYLHSNLQELGISPSQSQIQPLITGDSQKALKAYAIFKDAGLLAMPIRHPTVPENKARLRLSLNCNLRIDDIELISALVKRNMSLFVQNA